jgi:hypothetical protein
VIYCKWVFKNPIEDAFYQVERGENMKDLKYPEGSIIMWCDEYYKVIRNSCDWSGSVMDTIGDVISNFYFKYQGEEAILITNKDEIKKVENWIQEALNKKHLKCM